MIDPECPIWKAGKGFCWCPSAAWGCSDAELCGKCQAKDAARVEAAKPIPLVRPRICACGTRLSKGRERCSKCLTEPSYQRPRRVPPAAPEERTCRFCGLQWVALNKWRKKERMCSSAACWAAFLEELKSQPVAI